MKKAGRDMTLPYRTDGPDLERFIDALARGRSPEQAQTLNFSQKGFEGTMTAAECLGLATRDEGGLTDQGRAFALASEEERRRILLVAIQTYEPYGLLLEAIQSRREATTETDWIETWWSTHGFGTSGSNRSEGSSTLARFLEYAGIATYIQGRRGHPSRIEWRTGALGQLQVMDRVAGGVEGESREESGQMRTPLSRGQASPNPDQTGSADPIVELSMPLSGGRTVYMRLPHTLSTKERERLLALIGHLVSTEDPQGEE